MYQKPEMKILELNNEDIILTSSLNDMGDGTTGDLDSFDFPDTTKKP